MITIIEGPDGVGKTEYARYLSMGSSIPVLHWGAPTHSHWIDEYVMPVDELLRKYEHVICDRGFFAEPMWAKIFERPTSLFAHPEDFEACARWYQLRGCQIVFIERDVEGIIRTSQERGESREELARTLESVELYKLMARVTEATLGIPTTVLDSDVVHEEVQRWS